MILKGDHPSIPTLVSGPLHEIMSIAIGSYSDAESVLLVEAVFAEENKNIKGSFYLVFRFSGHAGDSRRSVKKMLESLEK